MDESFEFLFAAKALVDGEDLRVSTVVPADIPADQTELRLVDSLTFEVGAKADSNPNELEIEASAENLQKVIDFVNARLDTIECPPKPLMQMEIAVEEIFVNICSYAYDNGNGKADVCIISDKTKVTITFTDSGKQFDPTKDVLDIEDYDMDNSIGGLGRFLTFNIADDYSYEYKDGKNILSITKNI